MNLRPVIVSRRSQRTRRPELTLSPGPAVLAQPGGGSFGELYGCPWALALHRTGPQLYQVSAGAWVPREDPGGALTGLVRGVRWIGLAWDQAARPVVSWELDGAVYVRQWDASDAQYVTRGPWAGHDPVILADATATGHSAGSNVLLWHLDAARAAVVCRAQVDRYATAYPVAAVSGAVLDQVTALGSRWQLLGEDVAGLLCLSGDPYPVQIAHTLTASGRIGGAELVDMLRVVPVAHALTASARIGAAELLSNIRVVTLAHALTAGGRVQVGTLATVSIPRDLAHTLTAGGRVQTATLSAVGIPRALEGSLTASGRITGGTYA